MSIRDMESIHEVLQETGISYHTLVKYAGMGLLPKPQRVWRGRKGSESLYPDDVIDIISRIKEEQDSGLTLRQIVQNWEVIKATDAFTAVIRMFPDYHFISGEITEKKDNPDGSIVVKANLVGVKRR